MNPPTDNTTVFTCKVPPCISEDHLSTLLLRIVQSDVDEANFRI